MVHYRTIETCITGHVGSVDRSVDAGVGAFSCRPAVVIDIEVLGIHGQSVGRKTQDDY